LVLHGETAMKVEKVTGIIISHISLQKNKKMYGMIRLMLNKAEMGPKISLIVFLPSQAAI